MCVSLGEVLVKPLAEALSVEERTRTRERLTAHPHRVRRQRPPDRRTAEELAEPGRPAHGHLPAARVRRQRSAAGSDRAARRQRAAGPARGRARHPQHRHRCRVSTSSQQALTTGSDRSREAIMQSISSVRDERAGAAVRLHPPTPCDHRGPLASTLPARDRVARRARTIRKRSNRCKEALYRGEWWAPRRTTAAPRRLRRRPWRASAHPRPWPRSTKPSSAAPARRARRRASPARTAQAARP